MQDRFVAATNGTTPPAPLLFHGAPRTRAWLLLGASAVLGAVAMLVLAQGWGDLSSDVGLHGPSRIALDVLLFSAAAYCFVHAAAVLRSIEALPFRAGIYVFPACVVDASTPVLRVWSMVDVDVIERLPDPALAVRMRDGQRVTVPAKRGDDVQRVDAALSALRPELMRALTEDDGDMLAQLDPLHQSRVSSPISSTQQLQRVSPLWARFDWLLAAALGAGLGIGLAALRNGTSDERMFRRVAAAADASMYQQYLARGGRHSGVVRDVLLPRAELYRVQAQAEGPAGLQALKMFARTHDSAQIRPEIEAATRRLLLLELDNAKAMGTVAALDAFAASYPDSHLDGELTAARHDLYAKALSAWKAKARADAAVIAFIERLLGAAEKSGPSCEVRFRLKPSKTLDEADRRIAKHVNYPGPEALPSHYFTAEAVRPHEQHVAQAVADRFAAQFPADILAVHAGEPLAPDAPLPGAAPVLVVEYAAEWSSANTLSVKPRSIFAGIRFDFDAHFALPEGAPLDVVVKSWRGPELWKLKNTNVPLADFEQKVYEQILDRGFDDLWKRLNDTFFRGQ